MLNSTPIGKFSALLRFLLLISIKKEGVNHWCPRWCSSWWDTWCCASLWLSLGWKL